MTTSTKRVISILLILTMALGALASCKKTEPTPENTPTANAAVKLENAYTETVLPLEANAYAAMFFTHNDRLYFMRNTDNARGEYAEGPVVSTQQVVSTDLNGNDEQVFYELTTSYDETEDMFKGSNTNLSAFAIAPDGSIYVLINTTTYDTTNPNNPIYDMTYELLTLAADGTEQRSLDLTDLIGANDYINRIAVDNDGSLYLISYGYMLVLDGTTGEQLMKHTESGYIFNMFVARDGLLYFAVQDNMGNMTFKTADLATKTMKTAYTYTGSKYFYEAIGGSGDYDVYFLYSGDIYGLAFETMQDAIVVSGINSDLDLMNASIAAVTEDGFIVTNYDYSQNGRTIVSRLVANPDATIGDKAILTLGSVNGVSNIMAEIRKFNKESTTARIMVTDYSAFNDYNNGTGYEGITRLDNDILAGKMPDIMLMTGLQASKYAAKDILEDLYPYLDADPTLGRDAIFPNILEMGEYQGQLSHIIPGIAIITLAGKQSIFGERTGITTDELAAIADANPDSAVLSNDVTADTWMLYTTLIGLDRFVNWETGTCSFDSPDFIAALNFAKRFTTAQPDYNNMTEEDWRLRQTNMTEGLLNGKILLSQVALYQDVRGIRSTDAMFGEPAAFVGFPAPEGYSGHAVVPQLDFAISSTSNYKDEAWEFISRFLQPDYSNGDAWNGVLSSNIQAFEENAALEMLPLSERDLSSGLTIIVSSGNSSYGTIIYSEEEYESFLSDMTNYNGLDREAYGEYPMTAEEIDRARQLIESASFSISMNEQIQAIMSEETQPFLAGAKTAEETAKIIQSRISLYVSETR